MAKTWADVAASSAFQSLSVAEQEEARRQYFDQVVAPQVPDDDLDLARSQFDKDTRIARRDLPEGVTPSTAGAGRGSVNPHPVDDRGIVDKVSDFFTSKPQGSVLDKGYVEATGAPAPKALIERRGAPVSEEQFTKLKQEYDAATPQERASILQGSDYKASVFKSIDDQYRQLDNAAQRSPTAAIFDTRREARRDSLIGQGLEGSAADAQAAADAASGKPTRRLDTMSSFEGKNFFQSLVDKTIAKPMDNSLAGAAIETAGDAVRGIASGYTSLPAAAWDALYMASESAGGLGSFGAIAREAGKSGRESMANWQNAKDPNSVTKSVFESTTQMLMSAGLTGGFGNASIGLSSGISAANAYGEARQAGKDHDQASERAAVNFIAEYLGEKVSLPALQKLTKSFAGGGTTKEFIGAVGDMVRKDLVGEEFTTAVEDLYDKVGSGGLRPNMTWKDYLEDVVQTAKVTIGQAALMGGAGLTARKYQEATDTPEKAIAREMNAGIAGTEFAVPADQAARDLLNPNTYDERLVSPVQTSKIVSFTPDDSATKQAGLVDIEVPIPNAAPVLPPVSKSTEEEFGLDTLRMGDRNVSTVGATATEVAGGGVVGGDQLVGGVGLSGSPVVGAAEQLGRDTRLPATNAGQTVVAGDATDQRAASVAPQNNNANTQPAEQWFGRKGDGYMTEADAAQALGGRQRMFPTLDWKIEQMPSGKFRLAGYNTEINSGTQTAQAVQAEAQGQQQAPATSVVPAVGAQAPAATQLQGAEPAQLTLSDQDRGTLKAALPAPMRVISDVRKEILKSDRVEMSVVPQSEITDQQRVAGALLRSLGKSMTVVRSENAPGQLSNGMINRIGGQHIFIADDTEDAPLFVAAHEAYHGLPQEKRQVLNKALLEVFNEDQKSDFLKRFNYTEDQFDEEAPAFMAQAISKREDFWNQLRTKLGDAEFADVAKIILAKFKEILSAARSDYGDDFVKRYIKDVERAQDLLSTAYADAVKAHNAEQGAAAPTASTRVDIGAKLQDRVNTDFTGAVQEYSQLDGAEGGRLLDTDLVRELSPEYRADRSRAPEVHEAASDMTQRMFEARLQQQKPGTVAFMAGGGGAGKSSAQTLLKPQLAGAHTVLDGTLSGYDKARRNVQQALDSGNRVLIAYIYRDPVEALRNGVLTRAMKRGRTVTLDALVKGHAGSSEVVRKLQEEFGSNPRFKVFAIDNSKGEGKATLAPLESITPVIKSGLKERLHDATEQEYKVGRISETVYRATVRGYSNQGGATESGSRVPENVQGNRADVQERRRPVQQRDALSTPVTADEAVVNGVLYSNRKRDLVDIPTIDLKDLVGKKVFGIKADLTDAGRSYTGIDGSQLEFPVEMMGGPNYVRLPENAKTNVIWAVRGGAVLTKILKAVDASDYVLVHAMNGNSHLTNTTISTAYLQTVEAYLRDGRISRENLLALDEIVRSPDNKTSLPDFPGFESPDIYDYIDSLSFNDRGALAKLLEKKEAQAHGLPNLDRFRRETIDQDFVGYRQGDAMLVLQIDKKNPTVKLGEEGTKMHPSYPLGLRGKVVGKLSKGVNYEVIYRDYFENKVPTLANKEEGAWYTFDRATPIQEITPEIANSVEAGGYKSIKSARQAEAALAMANNNWLVSGKTKADGGVSVQEFVDALRANEGAAALTMYDAKDVKAGIKDGSFRVYQLGSQGGDKGIKVFFGLKRGEPWYKGMIDGVGSDEVEVVSVTNNEPGATGVGIPAIITKAISEGATVLDAFAVKSKRFPDGFLPEMYAQFGFEEIGRIPFDPSYYDATQMADLKDFWSRGGWSEADGYPDVVVMRWKGNDEDRATAVERYVRSGETSVSRGVPQYTRAAAGATGQQRDTSRGAKGRTRLGDGGQARGDQGAGDAASVVKRAYDSIREIAGLGEGDIRNLGLDPAAVDRLRGVARSNRLAKPAAGSSTGRDQGDAVSIEQAVHFGRQAGLSFLSGTSFGSGIKGAEQARLSAPNVDPRIKRRVYFYLPVAGGIAQPEIGLGANVYTANLSNLYDPAKGTRSFPTDPNAFESAVLDAGYRGYVNRAQGTAVVLNSDVPVKFVGKSSEQTMVQRKPTVAAPTIATRTEGEELVRKPTNDEMAGIIKARPALAKVAPSFRLEFGEARVKQSEAEAADNALADAGASFQFGGVMASKRVQTDTPAFKRWFGDSKVVNEDGTPKVMYHGTSNDFNVFDVSRSPDASMAAIGAIFVTDDPKFANDFTYSAGTGPLGGNIMPVYVRAENPFDFDNAAHRAEVIDDVIDQTPIYANAPDRESMRKVLDESIEKKDGTANWGTIENETFLNVLKEHGFDSFYVREGGRKNLGLFSNLQVKSATGNNGEFDATNPDIRRSNRASLAEDLAKQEEFLQRKAEEAGYKTIDEFVDNDYAAFVKAAEEWRDDHPADLMMSKRSASDFLLTRDDMGNFKFAAGAKLYRAVADIANNVLEKTPLVGSLKPISKDLSLGMRRMKAEIEQAREKTAGVAGKLGKLGEDEREMISDVIEGELKAGVKPPKRILQLAASMKSIMSEQTDELVRLGMLSKDAANRWDGKYLPRFYEQTLKSEANQWAKAAKALLGRKKTMQGIGGSSLNGRGIFERVPVGELESWLAQGWEERDPNFDPDVDTEITVWRDYSREEREKMGEIRDAMFRFVMGYMKSQKDIALGRLYENLANTVATKKVTEGYVQVPTSKIEDTTARRYGKLAGMYVPQEVMDHLSAHDSTMDSELYKIYRKALSMWKEGKTVLNPVAHANNVLSNLTMAHFAGVSYWDAHKYAGAVRDIVKGDKMVKEAREAGLFGGTVSQEELVSMLPDQLKVLAAKTESKVGKGVDTVWSALSFFMRKPLGVAYEAEDLFFRYLIYREARARGLKPEAAVSYAQEFIFTYDDLPKGARTIRDAPIGIPFFSWTFKAIPVIARTALEYPWRFAGPAAAMYAANAAMYAIAAGMGGGDDEGWWEVIYRYITDSEFRAKAKAIEEQERRYLPEWMKGNTALGTPKAIRLGTDDLTNLPVFLDVSRIFPGGDLGDFTNNAGGVPLPAWLTPNNPVISSMTAYLQNKDAFTGKDIVNPKLDTGAEKAAKFGEYAWRQFAPAVAPFNYHFDRTMNALANATGKTIDLGIKEYTGVDKMGQPVQPKYAAMQTFGIKARPIDLEVSEQIEKSQRDQLVRELDKQIRQIQRLERKGYYSDERADQLVEPIKEKRQRLKEGLTIEGEERK